MSDSTDKATGPGVGEALWMAVRMGTFLGAFLALPVCLAFKTDYAPTAIVTGVISFLLTLLAAGLCNCGEEGRLVGRLLLGVLLAGAAVGLVSFIVLKIEVSSRRNQAPTYQQPVRPTFVR